MIAVKQHTAAGGGQSGVHNCFFMYKVCCHRLLRDFGRPPRLIWELPGLSWKLPWEVSGHLKLIYELLG